MTTEKYDRVRQAGKGAYEVERTINGQKKYNLMDENGRLMSETWYDMCSFFSWGWAAVYIYGKGWNYINREGEYISDEWFDDASTFFDGYALVHTPEGYNHLDTDGSYVSETFYKEADTLVGCRARVSLDGEHFFEIDNEGNPIPEKREDDDSDFIDESVNRAKNLIGRLELIP